MKQLFTSILLLATVCAMAQTTIIDSIMSNGIMRNYRLYKPAAYTGTSLRPLVINLHGYTSNAAQQQLYSNFMPIADTANFLMVVPNGTFAGGALYWNAGISTTGANDVLFISDLIAHLKQSYAIDLNRVYSTGMSNGGFMSHTLACALNNKIAAVASVTGSMFTTQKNTCVPNRAVPVMQISGTADATVPYTGGTNMEPIDNVVSYWVANNNCNTTPTTVTEPNISLIDGCTAMYSTYTGGANVSTVELYKIIGGGHTWPGAAVNIGVTNQDINASKEIWRFFSKYSLSQFTSIANINGSANLMRVYPNPATNILTIDGISTNDVIKIIDVMGKELIVSTAAIIDISSLPQGVYTVEVNNAHKQLVKY
jgi:polyhydroxybutyrate depolymerase